MVYTRTRSPLESTYGVLLFRGLYYPPPHSPNGTPPPQPATLPFWWVPPTPPHPETFTQHMTRPHPYPLFTASKKEGWSVSPWEKTLVSYTHHRPSLDGSRSSLTPFCFQRSLTTSPPSRPLKKTPYDPFWRLMYETLSTHLTPTTPFPSAQMKTHPFTPNGFKTPYGVMTPSREMTPNGFKTPYGVHTLIKGTARSRVSSQTSVKTQEDLQVSSPSCTNGDKLLLTLLKAWAYPLHTAPHPALAGGDSQPSLSSRPNPDVFFRGQGRVPYKEVEMCWRAFHEKHLLFYNAYKKETLLSPSLSPSALMIQQMRTVASTLLSNTPVSSLKERKGLYGSRLFSEEQRAMYEPFFQHRYRRLFWRWRTGLGLLPGLRDEGLDLLSEHQRVSALNAQPHSPRSTLKSQPQQAGILWGHLYRRARPHSFQERCQQDHLYLQALEQMPVPPPLTSTLAFETSKEMTIPKALSIYTTPFQRTHHPITVAPLSSKTSFSQGDVQGGESFPWLQTKDQGERTERVCQRSSGDTRSKVSFETDRSSTLSLSAAYSETSTFSTSPSHPLLSSPMSFPLTKGDLKRSDTPSSVVSPVDTTSSETSSSLSASPDHPLPPLGEGLTQTSSLERSTCLFWGGEEEPRMLGAVLHTCVPSSSSGGFEGFFEAPPESYVPSSLRSAS